MSVFLNKRPNGGEVSHQNRSPASPVSTTWLAEGYTDDGQLSRYENVRPQSRFSGVSTLNSRTRFSQVSPVITDDISTFSQMIRFSQQISHGELAIEPHHTLGPPPRGKLARLKYYYDKYKLRKFALFLLLILYSLIGAWVFYFIEHDNEQELLKKERQQLDQLRNDTLIKLRNIMLNEISGHDTRVLESRDILLDYERKLAQTKLPEGLEWDIWGALFYVGTIFTTIGYGNIAPRTSGGQILTIAYAIFGIPLVLAILSQMGKKFTKWASEGWIKYRQYVKQQKLKKILRRRRETIVTNGTADSTAANSVYNLHAIEEGRTQRHTDGNSVTTGTLEHPEQCLVRRSNFQHELLEEELFNDEDDMESRTIPVWLALFICVGWICGCAGLFCCWETKWNYFTSLYFFCISLSTIGLGDVVPDHPRMLILLFWLVIIGLSIVSMLLSVIQIKLEEWLAKLKIKMQREYRRAMENGDPVEREKIMEKLLQNEPWFMKNMAMNLISEKQAEQLNHEAETFERVIAETNNKNVQTESLFDDGFVEGNSDYHDDKPTFTQRTFPEAEIQTSNPGFVDIGTSACSNNPLLVDQATSDADFFNKSPTTVDETISPPLLVSVLATFADSISDATSLPMDPLSPKQHFDATNSVQEDLIALKDQSMQTDLAQFEIDEIALRLHTIQEQNKNKPTFADQSMETSMQEPSKLSTGMKTDSICMESKESQINILPETVDKGTSTDYVIFDHKSMETETPGVNNRSMETVNSGLWRGECSRSVQTNFNEDDMLKPLEDSQNLESAKNKRRRFSHQKLGVEFEGTELSEMSVQCHLLAKDTCDMAVQTIQSDEFGCAMDSGKVSRSESILTVYHDSVDFDDIPKKKVLKQDLIIQTDDSYLKIARRLDEYRTNRTQSLHVCAAPHLLSTDSITNIRRDEPNSPIPASERREYEPSKKRKSTIDIRRRRSMHKPVRSPQPTAMYEESEFSEPEEGQSKVGKVTFDFSEQGPATKSKHATPKTFLTRKHSTRKS